MIGQEAGMALSAAAGRLGDVAARLSGLVAEVERSVPPTWQSPAANGYHEQSQECLSAAVRCRDEAAALSSELAGVAALMPGWLL